MNRSILVLALCSVLCALPSQAQQAGPVALGPATPPDLAGANRAPTPVGADAVPDLSVLAAAAAPAKAAPAAAPAPPAIAAAAKVEPAQAKPTRTRAPARRTTPQRPPEPYADLPINAPAREALRVSEGWAGNDGAIVAGGADGRVVFNFGEAMPTVVCAPLRMCEIELQPGERVMESPHIGDPVRWSVSPGFAGAGEGRTTHVIIKPHGPGLDTNLLIPTDRRMYRIRLVSSESNYVTVVSFNYPRDDRAAWDAAISSQATDESRVVAELPAMSVAGLQLWRHRSPRPAVVDAAAGVLGRGAHIHPATGRHPAAGHARGSRADQSRRRSAGCVPQARGLRDRGQGNRASSAHFRTTRRYGARGNRARVRA